MAVMKIETPDALLKQLENVGAQFEDIAKEAVRAGADILADKVRANLERNLAGSDNSTGELLESFGVTPARMNTDGTVDVKVGFAGYDKKRKPTPGYPRGVPNIIKARAMESGTSRGQTKRPFFRQAVNATRKKIVAGMQRKVSEKINNI